MNIASDVKTYIISRIPNLYATLVLNSFADTSDSLKIMSDPSSAVGQEFVDGSFTGQQQLSFYARSKNSSTAISALDSIIALFNQPQISLTDVLCISVLPLSTVSFVEKLTTGESIYTCSVVVKYDGQNPID